MNPLLGAAEGLAVMLAICFLTYAATAPATNWIMGAKEKDLPDA